MQEQFAQDVFQDRLVLSFDNKPVSFAPMQLSNFDYPNKDGDTVGALPFPRSPYTGKSVTTVSATMYVVNASSKNLSLALDFVLAALSRPAQEKVALETLLVAARKDARLPAVSWFPAKEDLDAVLDNARGNLVGEMGNRSVYTLPFEKLITGDLTAKAAAEEAARELRNVLEQKDSPTKQEATGAKSSWFAPASGSGSWAEDEGGPPSDFDGVVLRWLSGWGAEGLQLAEAFNERADDTRIYVYVIQDEDTGGYTNKAFFERSLVQGQPVDLVTDIGVSLADMVANDSLEPLDHHLRFVLSSVPDGGILDQARYQGKLFGIPMIRIPRLVVARKGAWERTGFDYPKNGWSWDEFSAWVTKAVDPVKEEYGVAVPLYCWNTFFRQMGGRLSSGPYEPVETALSLLSSLAGTFPKAAWVSAQQSVLDVINGKATAFVGSVNLGGSVGAELRKVGNSASSLAEVIKGAELMLLPLPTPSGKLTGGGSSARVISVPKQAPHLEEAMQFLQWALSAEASLELVDPDGGRYPVSMYPEVYQMLKALVGPDVESLFPVAFTDEQEIHPFGRELLKASYTLVAKYLAGAATLHETVAAMEEELPRIAHGLQ